MNKYQKAVLKNEKGKSFFSCSSKKSGAVLNVGFDYDADCYKLIQEEDIFSTQYEFAINATPNIESCAFLSGGKWKDAHIRGSNFLVVLDFEHRIEKIKLVFADNIVDDYIFSVQYIEADRELYYQKQAETRRNTYIEAAKIKHSTGAALANIYFQPCCADYGNTEIELWLATGKFESIPASKCVPIGGPPSPAPRLLGGTAEQLIAKFVLEEGVFFKSIDGLANGVYGYRVSQYTKEGKMLFESDFQFFSIRSQGSGRPLGHINRI